MTAYPHTPVLLQAILDALPERPERIIDGTLGAGGHSTALLAHCAEASLIGFDVDDDALQIARPRLSVYGDRAHVENLSYQEMTRIAATRGWDGVDFILLDLGVSSMQVDRAERGFSFAKDGPLDMRFDQNAPVLTAADYVNRFDADDLADIFFEYGEERFSRRIARAIVRNRPFYTTAALADVVAGAVPRNKQGRIHPATRVFQALRIVVNEELNRLTQTLPAMIDLLRAGGRLAIISFHSLEDRQVKQCFRHASTEIKSPPGMMLQERSAVVKLITRKPITATPAEIAANPRSRSAKLRIVEKL